MAKKPAKSKKSPTAKAARPAGSTKKRAATRKSPAKTAVRKPAAAKAASAPRIRAVKIPSRKAAKPGKSNANSEKLRQTVDGYVSTLNDWRKECVARLRTMIRTAAPKASEGLKWSQPVYEHHGPLAWIKAHAKHVNLGFWRGVELPDPRKLLKSTGQKMRHIKLSSLKEAGKKELQELVRLAAELNEARGTRRVKKTTQSKSEFKE